MKSTIETTNCMNDALYESRFSIRKNLLIEARNRGLQLIDENVVIFSHQEISAVTVPFDIDPTELDKNQPLIFFYFKGNTRATLEDGFYIVQGNLDKNGISPKNLLLLNEDGKEVQALKVTQARGDGAEHGSGLEIWQLTDHHYVNKGNGISQKISGVLFGKEVEVEVDVTVSVKDK